MNRKLSVPATLQDDLKRFFEQQGLPTEDADQLIAKIWSEVAEAFDFADFVRQTLDGSRTGAELIDTVDNPPQDMSEERLQRIEQQLSRSRGKWAKDGI